jgi:hypothetical protein
MTTIIGYSVQYRPTVRHSWRIVRRVGNPLMAPALDALPGLVRQNGYGFYRLVKTLSDGRWSTPFEAVLTDDAATMSRELSPDERAELHGTDPANEEASEQDHCDRVAGRA